MFHSTALKLTALATLCAFALVPLAGCKEDESQHLIFIEPDGTVIWRVIEDLVRSTEDDPVQRIEEEDEALDELEAGEGGYLSIFEDLGAREVEMRYLRDTRPYTIVTRATFDDLEDLVVLLGEAFEEDHPTTLTRDGSVWTLRAELDTEGTDWAELAGNDGKLWSLTWVEARIVASQGRFIEAERFELSDDGAIATPLPLDEDDLREQPERVVYQLVWDTSA